MEDLRSLSSLYTVKTVQMGQQQFSFGLSQFVSASPTMSSENTRVPGLMDTTETLISGIPLRKWEKGTPKY